jgi:hypothetical protein
VLCRGAQNPGAAEAECEADESEGKFGFHVCG